LNDADHDQLSPHNALIVNQQHAPYPGSGLAGDCDDLYAIAVKAARRSGAGLAGCLGVEMEAAEDLPRAIVNRGDDFIWRLVKSCADVSVCLRHSLL
jgi:hypothetical protein